MGRQEKTKVAVKKPALSAKASSKTTKPKAPVLKVSKGAGYFDDLSTELAALGLRVKTITGDGNCLFRSLSDQTQGDESAYSTLRKRVLEYIEEHRDDFEPFIECDEPFDTYVSRMRKDGQWAGNLEIQAASILLKSNIAVYQAGQPRWTIRNFPDSAALLHISYHDGEHYNSVRLLDDWQAGPPLPIHVPDGAKGAMPKPQWGSKEEERVARSTACSDPALVRRALQEAHGDVDAAIERVIEVLAEAVDAEEEAVDSPASSAPAPTPSTPEPRDAPATGSRRGGSSQQPPEASTSLPQTPQQRLTRSTAAAARQAQECPPPPQESPGISSPESTPEPESSRPKLRHTPTPSPPVRRLSSQGASLSPLPQLDFLPAAADTTKAPARNKTCPCGSKKKYKSCCGAAAAARARKQQAASEFAADVADEQLIKMQTLYI